MLDMIPLKLKTGQIISTKEKNQIESTLPTIKICCIFEIRTKLESFLKGRHRDNLFASTVSA